MDAGNMTVQEYLALNAKLQQKKNSLRKALRAKGILKKGARNDFDNYTYFSEAQYKELFTELFSDHGLELSFTELEYGTFEGSEKQANGRMPKIQFSLTDIDTGFSEDTTITGEGIDKGDKAGYKAYTGALKYYLANTFMVATGDDAEKDSPEARMNTKTSSGRKASDKQINMLKRYYQGDNQRMLFDFNGWTTWEDIPMSKASELIGKIAEKGGQDK